jgi:effector-binding domain-containing protein
MKKIFLIALAVVVICVAVIPILIPLKIDVTERVSIDASDALASKFLINKSGWDKWWPGKKASDSLYSYGSLVFRITEITNGAIYLKFKKGGVTFNSNISYLASEEGAVNVKWNITGEGKGGIVFWLQNYNTERLIQQQTAEILNKLKLYLEDEINTYGYKIYINQINDTILLTTSGTYTTPPSVTQIYAEIGNLKTQAKKQGAKPTNFPMINIIQTNEQQYAVNIALPIDKTITPEGKATIKNMPKGSNLLVADVHSGPNTTNNAVNQLKAYMKDHRLVSPAMWYQSLITDRQAEKDTSKWITKIYYPIF